MAAQSGSAIKVFAPLVSFSWAGNTQEIPGLCQIRRFKEPPDLSCFSECLSKSDIEKIEGCTHWLEFKYRASDRLTPSETLIVFQFLLWLVIPTKTQIFLRFEFTDDAACYPRGFSRLLDRFQWIEDHTAGKVKKNHLEEISKYVVNALSVISGRKRLHNCLYMTAGGLRTIHWQPAFICLSSAIEGLLTYSSGAGITNRLAKSYACMVETSKTRRDAAYRSFRRLYGIRSDIVHGRASRLVRPKENLRELANLSDLLRKLWKFVLSNPSVIAVLEENDDRRRRWFAGNERSYTPPP